MDRHTGTTVALVVLVVCAGVAASASSQQTPVPIDPDNVVLRAAVASDSLAPRARAFNSLFQHAHNETVGKSPT